MNFKRILLLALLGALLLAACQDDDLSLDDSNPVDESSTTLKKCGTHEHTHRLMEDPAYRAEHEERSRVMSKASQQKTLKANCDAPTTIPVAVHYQGVNSPNRNCLIDLARRQIDRLNQDMTATNSDASRWQTAKPYFPNVNSAGMCIRFVIADQNHPASSGISDGQPAITINQTRGDRNSTWANYLNIYVRGNTGVLGYSPLGGSGRGDGIVIDFKAFGTGAGCGEIRPGYGSTLGRTLTHEVGHYLYLDHIWGDGCGRDDGVNDTPPQAKENYGCPGLSRSSCGTRDLHMNYMDYTTDRCMYMFTAGQVSRMTYYLDRYLKNITNKAPQVISGSTGDTSGDDSSDDTPTDNTPQYTIRVTLDNYGSETSWSLSTDAGQSLGKVGPYPDNQAGKQYDTTAKLPIGCYVLTLSDSYGDGMCCDYGNGRMDILTASGASTQLSNGKFGKQQQIRFCISNSAARVNEVQSDKKLKSLAKKV